MPSWPVPIHPSGKGTRGKRTLVVRAPTSLEEQAFFLKLKEKMNSPTMSDLIRYCCVRISIEEDLSLALPENWRQYYRRNDDL